MDRLKLPYRQSCEGYFVLGDSLIAQDSEYGYIDFPGGGVEEGEDIEEALKREVFEEAGAIVNDLKEVGVIKTIWPLDWAKNEKQRKRFEKYKGDETHIFIGKVKELTTPPGDSEEKGWDTDKRLMKISDAIEIIENYKPFPKELEEYYNFKLKILKNIK